MDEGRFLFMTKEQWNQWADAIWKFKDGNPSMADAKLLEKRSLDHLPFTNDKAFETEFKRVLRNHRLTMDDLTKALHQAADMTD